MFFYYYFSILIHFIVMLNNGKVLVYTNLFLLEYILKLEYYNYKQKAIIIVIIFTLKSLNRTIFQYNRKFLKYHMMFKIFPTLKILVVIHIMTEYLIVI